MDLKEFRLGSIINKGIVLSLGYYEGELYCGTVPNKYSSRGEVYSPDEIEPVELSDEWFSKLGFSKLDNKHILGDFVILYTEGSFRFMGYMKKEIKYVHELQNIYESLVEIELSEL
jgi:hypothetical protein